MSKKSDLKFTPDVDTFLAKNPHFAISKPQPNTGAIRAILRQGGKLDGVELVEVKSDTGEDVSVAEIHTAHATDSVPHFIAKHKA